MMSIYLYKYHVTSVYIYVYASNYKSKTISECKVQ